MSPLFDPGYSRPPFASLVAHYPGPDVYPPEDFRVEWGPIFHRGRLDGSAKVLVIGQDPGAHESIARRILVGEAGQRVQGFLARLGITTSYVMINAFLYSVYGQGGGERHDGDPVIARDRHAWLDALLVDSDVRAVVALGRLADHAFTAWRGTPAGQDVEIVYRRITHPTFPESASAAGQIDYADGMRSMLGDWNDALDGFRTALDEPDDAPNPAPYGESLDRDADLAEIPDRDLPAGTPIWMRSLDAWAARIGEDAEDKRATVQVRVPTAMRPWHDA
ncbi:MAG: uracil-DNA glycosylase family protein [Actinomycetota bacterium]